ncbi:MAG: YitT family protein [Clostridia bacterium]|nr:YitT family protein [Clostridia bacterium]
MKYFRNSELKNTLLILPGLFFAVLAFNVFLIPNNIAAGGFTGIGQLVNSATGFPVGTVSLVLNIPLFLVSMKNLGLRFGVRSFIATAAFSLLLDIVPVSALVQDRWLAAVYGGLFAGLGFGLILRGNATTGGTDMLASLIHRLVPQVRISWGIFIVDGLVILASAFVYDMISAMYALIVVFLCNIVVDFVLEGPNASHSFFIISDKSDEIARRIMQELDRGVTGIDATGMYSGKEKRMLLCVVNRLETTRLRRIVFSTDPRAFLISNKSNETFGEGFKAHR